MKDPEIFAERQIDQILKKTKFGDGDLLKPQSYSERLDNETRLWRAILIIPVGGLTAVLTAAAAFRLLPMEIAVPATVISLFIGLGIGEFSAIEVANVVTNLRSRRSS